MVRNRSRKEVEDHVSVQQAQENKYEFFSNPSVFSKLSLSDSGVDNLVKKVTSVLVPRLHDKLPKRRSRVVQILVKNTQNLDDIGNGAGDTTAEAHMTDGKRF